MVTRPATMASTMKETAPAHRLGWCPLTCSRASVGIMLVKFSMKPSVQPMSVFAAWGETAEITQKHLIQAPVASVQGADGHFYRELPQL